MTEVELIISGKSPSLHLKAYILNRLKVEEVKYFNLKSVGILVDELENDLDEYTCLPYRIMNYILKDLVGHLRRDRGMIYRTQSCQCCDEPMEVMHTKDVDPDLFGCSTKCSYYLRIERRITQDKSLTGFKQIPKRFQANKLTTLMYYFQRRMINLKKSNKK